MSENKVVDADTCCDNDNQETLDSLNRQEQNWKLMTVLQIPWHHANKIEDESDRDFLLNKAKEVESFLQTQHMTQQMQGGPPEGQQPPSPIITPN